VKEPREGGARGASAFFEALGSLVRGVVAVLGTPIVGSCLTGLGVRVNLDVRGLFLFPSWHIAILPWLRLSVLLEFGLARHLAWTHYRGASFQVVLEMGLKTVDLGDERDDLLLLRGVLEPLVLGLHGFGLVQSELEQLRVGEELFAFVVGVLLLLNVRDELRIRDDGVRLPEVVNDVRGGFISSFELVHELVHPSVERRQVVLDFHHVLGAFNELVANGRTLALEVEVNVGQDSLKEKDSGTRTIDRVVGAVA
jgi:hypothetical protein